MASGPKRGLVERGEGEKSSCSVAVTSPVVEPLSFPLSVPIAWRVVMASVCKAISSLLPIFLAMLRVFTASTTEIGNVP